MRQEVEGDLECSQLLVVFNPQRLYHIHFLQDLLAHTERQRCCEFAQFKSGVVGEVARNKEMKEATKRERAGSSTDETPIKPS